MEERILLTNLVIVFFQRTKFLDIGKAGDELMNTITPFKPETGTKKVTLHPNLPLEDFPRAQIISNDEKFQITMYDSRIDFGIMGLYKKEEYAETLYKFIEYSKQIAPFAASEANICGRIGIVNDTFIVNDNTNKLVMDRYIRSGSIINPTQIALTYTEQQKIGGYQSNIINMLQPGELKTNDICKGLALRRDVNIKDNQNYINEQSLCKYISNASTFISCKSMEMIVYGK